MGFNKAANGDVVGTLKTAVDKINALPIAPEFILHTGDISHLSKPEEFDTVDQVLKSAIAKDVFYVPGEHDVLNDDGKQYLERYGKSANGSGWYSFDKKGVHFIGLVNVMNLKPGGRLARHDQLEWLNTTSNTGRQPDRRVRAHAAVVGLPEWAGDRGQRTSAVVSGSSGR
jgi:3',5'-cyclic AMP phosphodiesterase CpdA